MIFRTIFYLILAALILFVAEWLPINFTYSDLKDYLGMLSNISGMVFTIMGIWIALVYPNALSRIVSPDKIEMADFSETLEDTKRLETIVAAILQSALVLIIALTIVALKTIFYKTTIYSLHMHLFKSITITIVAIISIIQFKAVMSVVLANIMFLNDLHRKRREKQTDLDA